MLPLFTSTEARYLPLPGADVRLTEAWLSPTEAHQLFVALAAEPGWAQATMQLAGKSIAQPRLSIGYGATYHYSGVERAPQPWTPALLDLLARVSASTSASFNQALVQLYRDGQDSIGWHADDEQDLGAESTIAGVSLGGPRRMTFRLKRGGGGFGESIPVELTDGSLLVMRGQTQMLWQHAIPKVASAMPRISITFRFVHEAL